MLKTAKVVGLNLDTAASLVLVSSSSPQTRLYALISSSCDDAFTRTRQILSEAESAFYGFSGEEEDKTENSSVSHKLASCLEQIKKSLTDADSLQILLAATQDDESGTVFYLLSDQGQAEEKILDTVLVRGSQETSLCRLGGDQELVSGVLKEGDRVVMYTANLGTFLGADFRSLFAGSVDSLEEEIPNLLAQNQAYQTAAIVIEKPVESREEIGGQDPATVQPDQLIKESSFEKEIVAPRIRISIDFPMLFLAVVRGAKKMIPRSKRGILITGLMLVAVVVAGSVLVYRHQKEAETNSLFAKYLQTARDEYNKATSLKDLDPAASNQSLGLAKSSLAEALKIKPQDPAASDLQKIIEGNAGDILRAYQTNELPVWLDLDLIKKGLTARSLSLSHGKVLILDPNQKTLVSVNLSTKAPQTLAGKEQLGDAQLASLNGNTAWVQSADKGLVMIDTQSQKASPAVKLDSEWGTIADVYGFAGNIYLLDKGKNMIWKYLPVENGFTEKREYLKAKADLSTARKMQIDSSVWILKNNGEIAKYTQGSVDYFSIGGLDKGLKNPRSFFTSDETDRLYVLDSDNSRLVVFDKKGVYLSQYQSDQFSKFSDLVVDEENKKAYLLDNNKIYLLDLK